MIWVITEVRPFRAPAFTPLSGVPHWSDATHQAQSKRLIQFLKDLIASNWMNILSQYASDVVIIFMDESVAVKDSNTAVMCEPSGDNAFGYHNYFTTAKGNNCYYAVIPALDNACIINTCPSQNKIGNNTTSSSPFVTSGNVVYFRGTDNKLWKVNADGTGQVNIGGNTTKSTPFVTSDGWVWFQGTDNKLWKIFNDGTRQSQPGNNSTSSSPMVVGDWVYFQGTDNKLLRMKIDGSAQESDCRHTPHLPSPFVTSGECGVFPGNGR